MADGVTKSGAEGQAHVPDRGPAERAGWPPPCPVASVMAETSRSQCSRRSSSRRTSPSTGTSHTRAWISYWRQACGRRSGRLASSQVASQSRKGRRPRVASYSRRGLPGGPSPAPPPAWGHGRTAGHHRSQPAPARRSRRGGRSPRRVARTSGRPPSGLRGCSGAGRTCVDQSGTFSALEVSRFGHLAGSAPGNLP